MLPLRQHRSRRERKADERECSKINISMKTFGLVCEVDTLTRRRLKRSDPLTVLKGKARGVEGDGTNKMHFILRKCPQLKGHCSLPGTKW